MPTNQSSEEYLDTQIRKLPFHKLRNLDRYLETGDRDWKALISVMPEERYDQSQVDLIEHNGNSKRGDSCTQILIKDLCRLCVKVRELGLWLKKIENYEALEALDWPYEPVIIKTQPDGAILREGDSLYLRVDAVGYPLPKYQWYKDGAKIPDEIFKDLKIDKVTMAMDGQYKCLVENKENSVYSHEVTVRITRVVGPPQPDPLTVDKKPVIFIHPKSANVLPGNVHTLSCQATGQQPMTYVWYQNGQQLANTNSPTLEIPSFRDEHVGSYCCRISNACGPDAISELAELAVDQTEAPRNFASDKVALLIGNQDYTTEFHEALQGGGLLQHTIADTKTLGSLLHRDDMGFNVLSLGNLTRREMTRGVNEYLNLLSPDCYAFFYYAGHGFELNGKHYLLPVDAPATWKQEDAVCVQWILELMWKARPKMAVIILDMCRVRPTGKANFEDYDFPTDIPKIVFGFATCSQSEAYERLDEENGIYMKYLKNHICRNEKIEDVLHAVTTDVEEDTTRCEYTQGQRPEFVIKGGGYFSLRDPIEGPGNPSADRWLEAHKLPEKRIIEVQDGVKLEVRVEHSDWLSNSVNIVVAVIDRGTYDQCNAFIKTVMPDDLENHFLPQLPNTIVEPKKVKENPLVKPRSWPQRPSPRLPMYERATGMFHLQRLHQNVTVIIQLDCESNEERSTKYEVVGFSLRDFGLAQVFGDE